MKKSEFVAIYEEELARVINEGHPDYRHIPVDHVPTVVMKMVRALTAGTANCNGLALERTAKRCGVKCTRKDFIPFVQKLEE
jgi:hypothetical protein